MRYQVAPTGSRVRPWAVVDSERPDNPCVSRHMTAVEARDARDRLNLEAAAPDLLAALEALRNRWLGRDGETDAAGDEALIARVNAAIAKARGR